MVTIKMATKYHGVSIALSEGGRFKSTTLGGIANAFNTVDLGGDITRQGAFADTIKKQGSVPVLWQHQTGEPIGKTTMLRETREGLVFKAKIEPTRRGQEATLLSKAKVLTGVSIGYSATRTGTALVDGEAVRELLECKLYEISLVTFPMNEQSRLKAAGFSEELIHDLVLIAEVEDLKAKGWHVSNQKMIECIQAEQRQIERLQFGGKTRREADYALRYQVQEDLRELADLERRAARVRV